MTRWANSVAGFWKLSCIFLTHQLEFWNKTVQCVPKCTYHNVPKCAKVYQRNTLAFLHLNLKASSSVPHQCLQSAQRLSLHQSNGQIMFRSSEQILKFHFATTLLKMVVHLFSHLTIYWVTSICSARLKLANIVQKFKAKLQIVILRISQPQHRQACSS